MSSDFPAFEVSHEQASGVFDGLIGTATWESGIRSKRFTSEMISFLMLVDNNGVPRLHKRLAGETVFRTQPHGTAPYTYMEYREKMNCSLVPACQFPNLWDAVFLYYDFNEVDRASAQPILKHTDNHDFIVTSDGNHLFMAYEPIKRDLSAWSCGENPDGSERRCSTQEETQDSVILKVTPTGTELLQTNSWDDIPIKDCIEHRWPRDYAHINALDVDSSNHILGSYRGCSTLIKHHTTTGDVIWRLGVSALTDEEWDSRGDPPPYELVNDPEGEFCGNHSARFVPGTDGKDRILVFDNGGFCLGDRTEAQFSRAVQYRIEPTEKKAYFEYEYQKPLVTDEEHDYFGLPANGYAYRQGHVERISNGHGWSVGVTAATTNPRICNPSPRSIR